MNDREAVVRWFADLTDDDTAQVGGKNASLGEMVSRLKARGISVPDGFATTASAYRRYLEHNDLTDKLKDTLGRLNRSRSNLADIGESVRKLFLKGEMPEDLAGPIRDAYAELSQRHGKKDLAVAVRSSATAEDLPGASFAGQLETFLNISGEDALLDACRKCFASLFTDRAISYREEKGFDHLKVALSVGVQKMVRSDKAGSGVMFSLDTDTGFRGVVVINAAWGLGETVVQGTVNPDEYKIFKPLLDKTEFTPIIQKTLGDKREKLIYAKRGDATTRTVENSQKDRNRFVLDDDRILRLARWAATIEEHYGRPMDMEWALDGEEDQLYIVQARPETVHSQKTGASMKTYRLKERGEELVSGLAIGGAIATGPVIVIESADDIDQFKDGAVLVTGMTDPDWVPIMKKAAGIITDYGGRTSHAAIVSRELGIPAIVGAGNATDTLSDDRKVTLDCTAGDIGHIYEGELAFESEELSLEDIPATKTQVMMNIASPAASFRWWRLPTDGIGLARMEYIVNNVIKIHPLALLHYDDLDDRDAKKQIADLTRRYDDKTEYFVEHLAAGIAQIAAPQYPKQVLVRMSDFKSNEYANLIGGRAFEPDEENPMLGFRGASRYYSERYRDAFALECRAALRARNVIGMRNVAIMIPFCRTIDEADRVLQLLADNGLTRGKDGLEVYVMAEIPSNVLLADQFAARFDGFSIGSNDLTQLTLGVDRDSAELKELFDERDEAVQRIVAQLIHQAHEADTKVGICGQAPSDYPEFAEFLVREGIDSISLNPDRVVPIKRMVAKLEQQK